MCIRDREQGTYNGKVYGLPVLNVAISGIYYNKDMFEQYNLEVPTTISDLEKVCDTLVENGITPFALANTSKWTGSMYFMSLATRYGVLEPFQKAVSGEGTFAVSYTHLDVYKRQDTHRNSNRRRKRNCQPDRRRICLQRDE